MVAVSSSLSSSSYPDLSNQRVSTLTYVVYSALYYGMTPFVLIAKVIAIAKKFFQKHNEDQNRIKNAIEKHLNASTHSFKSQYTAALLLRNIDLFSDNGKKIILDVLALSDDLRHIPDILKGACICVQDKGALFNMWSQLDKVDKNASSSHNHNHGDSFRVEGDVIKQFLCWKNKDNFHTYFQLESNPVSFNPFKIDSSIFHLVDYFDYKRKGVQISQFGVSPYTESYPITFSWDKESFERNKNLYTTAKE